MNRVTIHNSNAVDHVTSRSTMPATHHKQVSDVQRQLRRQNKKRKRFASRKQTITSALPDYTHPQQTKTATNPYLYLVPIGLVLVFIVVLPHTSTSVENIYTDFRTSIKQIPVALLISAVLTYFLSGVVKGVGGVGMALASVPIMSMMFSPSVAIAIVSVPLIVTNVWQGFMTGGVKKTCSNYYPIITTMTLTMFITAYYSSQLPEIIFSLMLGAVAIVFAIINLGVNVPCISEKRDTLVQIVAGMAAGFAGGLSGLVAIPLLIYMVARQVKKEASVQALGVMFLISGAVLVLSYGMNGTLTKPLFLISCLVSVPALTGVFIGERIRQHIHESTFRRFVLILILAIGLKIIVSAVL